MTPEVIWIIFIFAFGSCIGSFLNVVIYRLPRGKSLAHPPSACPGCDKRIAFYDNIPLVSYLVLRGKCRKCKMGISIRYFCVELLTALLFVGVFLLYFVFRVRRFEINGTEGFASFVNGGWLFYVIGMLLIASFIAASAIDLELWVIPLSLCWFVTGAGFLASSVGGFVIDLGSIRTFDLLPVGSATTCALALGASVGLIVSLVCLAVGVVKPSYENTTEEQEQDPKFPHRKEIMKEVVFLLPVVLFAVIGYYVLRKMPGPAQWWVDISQGRVISGLLGSVWGYFIGCTVVWATRIFGTLGFGKEAMGLGDVHLMGAAGAIVGPLSVTFAFFIAPFFGILWAIYQMFFTKSRQIPYGPFLSLGVFAVMIFHDSIMVWWSRVYLAQ